MGEKTEPVRQSAAASIPGQYSCEIAKYCLQPEAQKCTWFSNVLSLCDTINNLIMIKNTQQVSIHYVSIKASW